MGRYFGIATRDITLYPIGGVARLESTGGKPHEEIAIAVAGPAVNLVITVLLAPVVFLLWYFFGVDPWAFVTGKMGGDWLTVLTSFLFAVCLGNLGLLLFNLLPAFPMDGGRVLRALLSIGMPRLQATQIAATVGLVLAGCLALGGLLIEAYSLVLVAGFVAFAGQMELWALRQRERGRRPAMLVMEPMLAEPVEPEPLLAEPVEPEPFGPIRFSADPRRFTGLAWDRDRGVWVRWVNGVPVE
jgi:Zn-dependent protease